MSISVMANALVFQLGRLGITFGQYIGHATVALKGAFSSGISAACNKGNIGKEMLFGAITSVFGHVVGGQLGKIPVLAKECIKETAKGVANSALRQESEKNLLKSLGVSVGTTLLVGGGSPDDNPTVSIKDAFIETTKALPGTLLKTTVSAGLSSAIYKTPLKETLPIALASNIAQAYASAAGDHIGNKINVARIREEQRSTHQNPEPEVRFQIAKPNKQVNKTLIPERTLETNSPAEEYDIPYTTDSNNPEGPNKQGGYLRERGRDLGRFRAKIHEYHVNSGNEFGERFAHWASQNPERLKLVAKIFGTIETGAKYVGNAASWCGNKIGDGYTAVSNTALVNKVANTKVARSIKSGTETLIEKGKTFLNDLSVEDKNALLFVSEFLPFPTVKFGLGKVATSVPKSVLKPQSALTKPLVKVGAITAGVVTSGIASASETNQNGQNNSAMVGAAVIAAGTGLYFGAKGILSKQPAAANAKLPIKQSKQATGISSHINDVHSNIPKPLSNPIPQNSDTLVMFRKQQGGPGNAVFKISDNSIDAAKLAKSQAEWSVKARLKKAQLPHEGKIRFVPPDNYDPSMPLYQRNTDGAFLDRFGNFWKKGPSRTNGETFEWDVQLSRTGKKQLKWLSRDEEHINVSLKGHITHR